MFRLLRRIDAAGSVSITALAGLVGLDRSTLGRNLRVLEKQSLVEIGTGKDGRARRVCLTEAGRAALHAALPLWRAAQQDFADLIGEDTLELLNLVIDRTPKTTQCAGDEA